MTNSEPLPAPEPLAAGRAQWWRPGPLAAVGVQALWVGAIAFVLAAAFQGTRSLRETSEGRYALAAQEMLHSGRWLDPTLDGQAHQTKPPVAYWAMAGGMALLGENAWGVRAPAVLAHAATAIAVLLIARMSFGAAVGWLAGLLYAGGWFPLAGANTVTTDVFVALIATAGVGAFVAASRSSDPARGRGWMSAMWIVFGFAFLTKGPPALLGLVPMFAWWLVLPRTGRPPLLTWPGGLGFVVTGFGWYAYVIATHPDAVERWMRVEIVGRMAGNADHTGGLAMALTEYVPALILAVGLPGLWALGRVPWTRLLSREAWQGLWAKRDPRLFALIWLLVPLAIFSAVPSKLPLYVLPLSAPVAILAAVALSRKPLGRAFWIVLAVSMSMGVAAKGVAAHKPSRHDMAPLAAAVNAARAAASLPEAAVVVADGERLLGLQFYLRERVVRWDRFEAGTPEDHVERAIAAIAAGGFPKGAVLVERVNRGMDVAARLRRAGLPEQVQEGRFWRLHVVAPRAATGSAAAPGP